MIGLQTVYISLIIGIAKGLRGPPLSLCTFFDILITTHLQVLKGSAFVRSDSGNTTLLIIIHVRK